MGNDLLLRRIWPYADIWEREALMNTGCQMLLLTRFGSCGRYFLAEIPRYEQDHTIDVSSDFPAAIILCDIACRSNCYTRSLVTRVVGVNLRSA
jgi:hypothetical protein